MSKTREGSRYREALPIMVSFTWLCLIGYLIWRHALASEQPLIGDARGYWMKARSFWHLVESGSWFNPFDIEPTKRPPGTILMSYPFGFTDAFKGFLFRSVFIPIALMMSAIFIAGRCVRQQLNSGVDTACIAALLCSAPLFYQFEYAFGSVESTYWGLVDSFLGALAAVATALAFYAVTRGSKAAALGAAIFASVAFATKPTGLFTVLLTGLVWIVAALEAKLDWKSGTTVSVTEPSIGRLGIGLLLYCSIAGPVIVVGRFFSEYFSEENVSYGNRALRFLREGWLESSFFAAVQHLYVTVGPAIALWILITLFIGTPGLRNALYRPSASTQSILPRYWIFALLFSASGLWIWLVYTGGSQVRYMYPFVLPAMIALTPIALSISNVIGQKARWVIRVLFLLPALNITMLLVAAHPSATWQAMSGANVVAGDVSDDMVVGKKLLQFARDRGLDLVVYEDVSGRSGIMDSFWGFERSANPSSPNVHVHNPVDFVRPAAFRKRELTDADFLLFSVLNDPREIAKHLAIEKATDFTSEIDLFQAWVSSLNATDGVQIFAETGNLRLLEIVDRSRLEKSLDVFIKAHTWTATFLSENPKTWWSEDEILRAPGLQFGRDGPVLFGDRFEVRGISVATEPDQLTVNVWWRDTKSGSSNEWYFFVHELDAAGVTLANSNVRLRDVSNPEEGSNYMMQSLIVPIKPGTKPHGLATGIFYLAGGQAHTLAADRGARDWSNQRLLVPVAAP